MSIPLASAPEECYDAFHTIHPIFSAAFTDGVAKLKLFLLWITALFVGILFFTLAANPSTALAKVTATRPNMANETMLFAGTFTNTQVNISGQITIALILNDDNTIEGNVDFSQFSNGQFTCGSGDFAGSKQGETIELNFTSNSDNPACGFYEGVTFTIEAALLNNTVIRGDYSTDTGQEGIVELRQILGQGLYLPLIRTHQAGASLTPDFRNAVPAQR
jgi:hypothetical protein